MKRSFNFKSTTYAVDSLFDQPNCYYLVRLLINYQGTPEPNGEMDKHGQMDMNSNIFSVTLGC